MEIIENWNFYQNPINILKKNQSHTIYLTIFGANIFVVKDVMFQLDNSPTIHLNIYSSDNTLS